MDASETVREVLVVTARNKRLSRADMHDRCVDVASEVEMRAAQFLASDPVRARAYYRGAATAWEEAARYASGGFERVTAERHAASCHRAAESQECVLCRTRLAGPVTFVNNDDPEQGAAHLACANGQEVPHA